MCVVRERLIIRHSIQQIRAILIVFAFILFVVHTMLPTYPGAWLLDGISILLLISTFFGISKFNLFLSSFFLVMTVVVGWTNDVYWGEIIHGFSYMVKLLLFICIVPIIAMPIQEFIPNIQRFIQLASKKISPRNVVNYTSFMLANLTNLASLPISMSIFSSTDSKKTPDLSFSSIIVRSFGIAMVCTPLGAAVAFAIDIVDTNFISLLGVNAFIVVLGLVISTLLESRNKWDAPQEETKEVTFHKGDWLFLARMLIPIVVYFVILTLIDENLPLGMMELIVLSILPFTLIWSMALQKVKGWWIYLHVLVKDRAPTMFNQFSVIISAGLTIYTIELVGLNHQILSILPGASSDYAAIIYIPVIIVVILLLAIIGVHQFVAIVFVGEVIDPSILGINHVVFASTLLVGFVSGMIASTFSGANILMSNLSPPMSPYVFAKSNYVFTMMFIGASVVYLILVNYLLVSA
ncbi:hypothetical protein [Aquibacillus albus]|uniref:Uncharacterized protein n=1 Tax=Aquibacillus albus TaxID=1168171 RepID=A0ABS2N623_9BACI|nr:hypothetical protein [Aquibacillus albus]MBM7573558.1 hypothetical protein [Aquibacillus albus]